MFISLRASKYRRRTRRISTRFSISCRQRLVYPFSNSVVRPLRHTPAHRTTAPPPFYNIIFSVFFLRTFFILFGQFSLDFVRFLAVLSFETPAGVFSLDKHDCIVLFASAALPLPRRAAFFLGNHFRFKFCTALFCC